MFYFARLTFLHLQTPGYSVDLFNTAMSGANQAYPQTVNLDTAKAKAADMQSQTSKAQGGNINPTDPASKARVRLCGALAVPHGQHACDLRHGLVLGCCSLVRGFQQNCPHPVT